MADRNLLPEQVPVRDEPTSFQENLEDTITAFGSHSVVSSRQMSVTAVDTVTLEPDAEGGRHILVTLLF